MPSLFISGDFFGIYIKNEILSRCKKARELTFSFFASSNQCKIRKLSLSEGVMDCSRSLPEKDKKGESKSDTAFSFEFRRV